MNYRILHLSSSEEFTTVCKKDTKIYNARHKDEGFVDSVEDFFTSEEWAFGKTVYTLCPICEKTALFLRLGNL